MSRWRLLSMGFLVACGEQLALGEGASPDAGQVVADAATVEDAGSDAAPPIETCDPEGAFGEAKVIGPGTISRDETNETGVTLTRDERRMIFSRHTLSPNSYDLLVASRPSRDVPFGAPTLLLVPNQVAMAFPSLTPDGLTLVFAAGNSAGSAWDLFESRRAGIDADFGMTRTVRSVAGQELYPFVASDGTELFFAEAPTDSLLSLQRASRTSDGVLAPPMPLNLEVGDANGGPTGRTVAPVLSSDGLTLYFAAGTKDDPNLDRMYVARRANRGAPFEDVKRLTGLDVGTEQRPGWISPNGCRFYFVSKTAASFDLFVAQRK